MVPVRAEQGERAGAERVRAWLDAPGLPLRVGRTYELGIQLDHPGLSGGAAGPPEGLVAEWMASSAGLRLAPGGRGVLVHRGRGRRAAAWVARLSQPIGREAGSIRLPLRVTPREAGAGKIAVLIVLRPADPAAGPGELYHRLELMLPAVGGRR